jgi:O-antigen/teichoic acid export membrane protein
MGSLALRLKNIFSSYKAAGIYTISGFLNKGIAFLFLPLLTHYLAPADYGIITLFSNAILFLTPFVSMSVTASVATDYFKYDASKFRSYFSTILILPLSISMLLFIILVFFGNTIASYFGVELRYLYIIPILTLAGLFFELLLTFVRNENKPVLFAILTFFKTIGELSIASFFIIKLSMNWQGRVWSWLIIGLLVIGYSLYYFYKKKYVRFSINKAFILPELKYSIPMIVNQFAIFMVISSDKFFISKYLSTEQVGIYGVASQIAYIIFAFSSAAIMSFNPYLYKALTEYNDTKKQEVKTKIFRLIAIVFGVCIIIAACTPLLYHFFINIKYHEGIPYVKWILSAYFFWFIYWLLLGFVQFYKLKKVILFSSAFCIILATGLIYTMVKSYGVNGALGALNISCFISAAVLFLIIKYKYKLL